MHAPREAPVPDTFDETPDVFVASEFSTLHLRDRVVIMALFDQIVTEQQVNALWRVWRQKHLPFSREPFWRLMTLLPMTDLELIYEEAARVAGVENAYITFGKSAFMVREAAATFPPGVWVDMVALPVLPIGWHESGKGAGRTRIFATHDPTHPLIPRLLHQVCTDRYELRYASKRELMTLMKDALPSAEGYS